MDKPTQTPEAKFSLSLYITNKHRCYLRAECGKTFFQVPDETCNIQQTNATNTIKKNIENIFEIMHQKMNILQNYTEVQKMLSALPQKSKTQYGCLANLFDSKKEVKLNDLLYYSRDSDYECKNFCPSSQEENLPREASEIYNQFTALAKSISKARKQQEKILKD
jgi:DNA repair ATPase RecN